MSLCKGGLFPAGRGRRALYLQTSRGGGRGDSRMGSEGQRKIRQRSQTLPHLFLLLFLQHFLPSPFLSLLPSYGLTQKIGLPTANIPKGIVRERETYATRVGVGGGHSKHEERRLNPIVAELIGARNELSSWDGNVFGGSDVAPSRTKKEEAFRGRSLIFPASKKGTQPFTLKAQTNNTSSRPGLAHNHLICQPATSSQLQSPTAFSQSMITPTTKLLALYGKQCYFPPPSLIYVRDQQAFFLSPFH